MENIFNQAPVWQMIAAVLFVLLVLVVFGAYYMFKPLMNEAFLRGVATAHKRVCSIPKFTRSNAHFEITKLIDEKAKDEEFAQEIRTRINFNYESAL